MEVRLGYERKNRKNILDEGCLRSVCGEAVCGETEETELRMTHERSNIKVSDQYESSVSLII